MVTARAVPVKSMTEQKKRKIRGTDHGMIRGRSRLTVNLGRIPEREYTGMREEVRRRARERNARMYAKERWE